jgi:hypothetical protein
MNKPSLDVVHHLVGLYPKAVEEHDKIGRLPLHLACSHHASFEVVEYIVAQYPEGVIELTDRGVRAKKILYHSLCAWRTMHSLIELFIFSSSLGCR